MQWEIFVFALQEAVWHNVSVKYNRYRSLRWEAENAVQKLWARVNRKDL